MEAEANSAESPSRTLRGWERPAIRLAVWIGTGLFCLFAWFELVRLATSLVG